VNDILLCNYNQTGPSRSTISTAPKLIIQSLLTVISASSDGTIKAWNPHTPIPSDPSTIGSHSDYVRCLAHWYVSFHPVFDFSHQIPSCSREKSWLASGSFDRTIKLWDLSHSSAQPSHANPLMTLNPPDTTAPKSSVYAIAADPFGHAIASGSPERVIRMWDPRSGRRTAKLVGHTDNIRAILISEDSRYVRHILSLPAAIIDIAIMWNSFLLAQPMVRTATYCLLIHCLIPNSVHQTLVASLTALPAHIYVPHRFRLVTLFYSPLTRNILFRGQIWACVQSGRRRLCRCIGG
jgi:hypothetical protein